MQKKILILSGSPRKEGNSDILCDALIKGAQEAGHTTEKIYVNDQKIGFCQACEACQPTGECFQKDDMGPILKKMVEADAIVLGTPVYFYSMSAQLKTLIDRTIPLYFTNGISEKDFFLIATAAEEKSAIEKTIDALRGFTDCIPESTVKGVVYGAGVYNRGDIKNTPAIDEAYQMGLNYAKDN